MRKEKSDNMERVIRKKIEENPERLTGSIQLNNKIEKYLDDPRVQEVYKIAVDIKSSSCYFFEDRDILNCYIPIKDIPRTSYTDYIQIRIFLQKGNLIEIFPPSLSAERWDKTLTNVDELREKLKYVLTRELEGEFGENLNFKLLKEYLEEE